MAEEFARFIRDQQKIQMPRYFQVNVRRDPITKNIRYELSNGHYGSTIIITEDLEEFLTKFNELIKSINQ